jgi:predicted ATPase
MRITRLQLTDYKCFEDLTLEGLGHRVVLVGPNGCGKSAVLEAIAALKEFAGTYNPQPQVYHRTIPVRGHTVAWPENSPLPIRGSQPTATISAELELDEAETAFVGGHATARVSVRIERSGEVVVTHSDGNAAKLFSHYDPDSGIGVMDYISPYRTFPPQKTVSINIGSISVNQQRMERIELPRPNYDAYHKFRYVKDFLVSLAFDEFSHQQSTGEDLGGMKLLREIFSDFFGPKILLGFRKLDTELQIAVRTPFGDHDIDQLSSGEKELFFVFVNLFRIRKLPSVILYDEPERHLNAGLETRIIPALDRLQTRNQLWIATHGVELVGSVPMRDIVAFKKETGSVRYERFAEPSRTDRVRLMEQLGAKVGLQLACNRVVFLEGKHSQADKRILDKLAGPKLPGVLFVASGPSLGVMGAGTRAGLLLEEASKDAAFLMVLDRDYRDAAGVDALEKKLNNRVYVWKCHEVENLLLSPQAILEVLSFSGVETFKSPEDVRLELQNCARRQEDLFVCQWVAYRLHNSGPTEEDPVRPTSEANLRRMAASARNRSAEAYSDTALDAAFGEVRREVRRCLGSDRWLRELPGKEILESFRQTHLPTVQKDTFKEQIVSAMLMSNHIPPDVDELCRFIEAH